MKLIKVDFYLVWPRPIKVLSLRKFIIKNLKQKGQIIRWSIIDIQDSIDTIEKKIRINAILAI